MAGEHPASWSARVREVAHRPPVGADSSALLPQVLLLPDYSEDGARGDLALLQLCRPVPLSARVQPVCLAVPGDRPPPGTPC